MNQASPKIVDMPNLDACLRAARLVLEQNKRTDGSFVGAGCGQSMEKK